MRIHLLSFWAVFKFKVIMCAYFNRNFVSPKRSCYKIAISIWNLRHFSFIFCLILPPSFAGPPGPIGPNGRSRNLHRSFRLISPCWYKRVRKNSASYRSPVRGAINLKSINLYTSINKYDQESTFKMFKENSFFLNPEVWHPWQPPLVGWKENSLYGRRTDLEIRPGRC